VNPVSDPGESEEEEKNTAENFFYHYLIKNYSLIMSKLQEKPSDSKEIIQHFKTGYRTPLNPDPVRNRIYSTG
jgi:hypothetical protein